MSSNDTVIILKNVFKSYRQKSIVVHALSGISLEIYRGEIACIVGPSGSGKTTLLNIVGGLDRADSGRVIVDGVDITELDEGKLTEFRLRKIGFVFQALNLIPILTAVENVELPLAFMGLSKKERRERALEALEMVRLGDKAYRKPDELSGGEQQRVAIARALVTRPSIVLMDEPTAHLDSETGSELMKLVKRLNSKLKQTFIIATHDPIVVNSCEKVIRIRDGKIISIEGGRKSLSS
ncbi:ABC transporter related [Ignisphaera aggregans DSM 17230]|uniref:ABC transporter related n=1 Tax=Ignisphaera aggregans (strain DSM 17230 / JCM 13409 / AQ1.S1) TaxID=583356 RepID=E0SSS2_IGNAA|nr:ABC transporter related [Ignisphaera aggregans DSM 17230]